VVSPVSGFADCATDLSNEDPRKEMKRQVQLVKTITKKLDPTQNEVRFLTE
jgi:hypothetical protein